MNNFNWQSFLRDNGELFKYKQEVQFPSNDYDIDKEAVDLDEKKISQICNHVLTNFFNKQKTGGIDARSIATEAVNGEITNKDTRPKENMDNLIEHAGICGELTSIYRKKNTDYGDSFSRTVEKYGLVSALTRISDKFNRLESLILHQMQEVKDESVQDTLLDLANYCIMTVMEIRKDGND